MTRHQPIESILNDDNSSYLISYLNTTHIYISNHLKIIIYIILETHRALIVYQCSYFIPQCSSRLIILNDDICPFEIVYLKEHQQSTLELILLSTASTFVQLQRLITVLSWLSVCLENVPIGSYYPNVALQTTETTGKVLDQLPSPLAELKKFLKGFVKSLLFAGGYSMLVRRGICWITQFVGYRYEAAFVSGMLSGITAVFEPIGRQSEIALFCLNKTMEVSYNMARRRNWPVKVPMGECWLTAVALAVICFVFCDSPDVFRENYRKVLNKLLANC